MVIYPTYNWRKSEKTIRMEYKNLDIKLTKLEQQQQQKLQSCVWLYYKFYIIFYLIFNTMGMSHLNKNCTSRGTSTEKKLRYSIAAYTWGPSHILKRGLSNYHLLVLKNGDLFTTNKRFYTVHTQSRRKLTKRSLCKNVGEILLLWKCIRRPIYEKTLTYLENAAASLGLWNLTESSSMNEDVMSATSIVLVWHCKILKSRSRRVHFTCVVMGTYLEELPHIEFAVITELGSYNCEMLYPDGITKRLWKNKGNFDCTLWQ